MITPLSHETALVRVAGFGRRHHEAAFSARVAALQLGAKLTVLEELQARAA